MDPITLPEVRDESPHPCAEQFAELRRRREERYANTTPTAKRRAVQTIVHNEPLFLPIWLGYYSRFFAPDDIYVLDNESDDGSTGGGGFVRIPVEHGSVDHVWMAEILADHQRDLLDRYDVVVTTDVDEIVAPVPGWGALAAYLDRIQEEFVNCIGYEILHMRDREPSFRAGVPVLAQRGYWFSNVGYDKPAVATEPMRWGPGLHRRADGQNNRDPDLRMIHLHRMDFHLCRERHRIRRRRKWNELDVEQGWALHNRLADETEFDRWFYWQSGFDELGVRVLPERIPPVWDELF